MKILLTGVFAELFETSELEIAEKVNNVSELKYYLLSCKPELSNHKMLIAVDSVLSGDFRKITEEENIIVFHPYSGG